MSDLPLLPVLIFGLFVAGLIALAVFSWRKERERRQAIATLAARLAFSLSPGNDADLAHEYREFRGLNTGDDRYAFNVMEGDHAGRRIQAFDFHYETSSTDSKGHRSTTDHYLHVVMLRLERTFPSLFVAPEGMFSKIAQAFGYDDIDFESHEFSRRYCVRSADRKFAYDFCNASMIDFLLAHASLQVETRDGMLALVFDGRIDPQQIESEINLACKIRDRMPDYLFTAA